MEIGRRIAAARALQRETQAQLAQKLTRISGQEWGRNDVAAIENGRRSLKAADLPHFAAAQEQDFSWYLDGVLRSGEMGGYRQLAIA